MVQSVRITYYGMEGEGRNLTEAKKDAGVKIERALSGSYDPSLLRRGKYLIFIWRMPDGWGYKFVDLQFPPPKEEESDRGITCYAIGGEDQDYKAVLNRALYHVAQKSWDETNDAQVLSWVKDSNDWEDIKGWIAFKRRYSAYRKEGLSDVEAHKRAIFN